MKRYAFAKNYENGTADIIETPEGSYVPAEVAERLYEELSTHLTRLDTLRDQWGDEGFSRTAADRIRAALKFADEYGGGSDERS